jgi:hypothetical protein
MGLENLKFNLVELKSNYYVEGFVSTTDPDLYDDVVTEEAQKKILRQLLNLDITMDEDHDVWRDPKTGDSYDRPQNKIPAAKIVDAQLKELDDGTIGTWVRVMLNKDYPLFEKLLNSIKNGFVHSFSIAYNVLKETPKQIGDNILRFIDDLNVFNVGMTGVPVNPNAKFQLALKSMSNKMAEENKIAELEKQLTELKSVIDKNDSTEKIQSLEKDVAELKSSLESKSSCEETKTEMKSVAIAELKSVNETINEQSKEIAELKSTLEKLRNTPISGAQMKSQTQEQKQEIKDIDFKSLGIGGTY